MTLKEKIEKQGNYLFKHRSKLPLIILVIGTYVYYQTETNSNIFFLEDTPYEIYYETLCLLISLFGLFIRIYTVGYTPANTSGRNTAQGQVADSLNTTGAYSIVRHPLYLGNFLIWLGICLLTGNLWFIIAFCLLFWIYYERIMFAEEEFLRNKFDNEYLEWANKTPAFIPKFKQFAKPIIPFSWKKVLKKEKDGLLALFLVFTFFNILGKLVDTDDSYNFYLLPICGIVIIIYIVLKILKYKTKILYETNS